MFGLEIKLFEQLTRLKEVYNLQGIKAEFEGEGSSFRDLVRLRRLTDKLDIPLFLKIGGVEALRDIKDSLELGVDGLIAPMVESPFGVKKFVDAVDLIYKGTPLHLSINIETLGAVCQVDDILQFAKGRRIDNLTVGRTDLSGSHFDSNIRPDSKPIFGLLKELGEKSKSVGMTMTVGGGISKNTVALFRKNKKRWQELILRLETRKVILPFEMMLKKKAVEEALRFEELYILSKREMGDLFMESETARLTRLKMRS